MHSITCMCCIHVHVGTCMCMYFHMYVPYCIRFWSKKIVCINSFVCITFAYLFAHTYFSAVCVRLFVRPSCMFVVVYSLLYVLRQAFVTHCHGWTHCMDCTYVTYIRIYIHTLFWLRCYPIHFDFGSSCPLGEERQLRLKVVNLSGIASCFDAHVVHLPAATPPAPPSKPRPSKGCIHGLM